MNTIKFTEEELNNLKDIANKTQNCVFKFGQVYIEREKIQISINELKKYEDTLKKEYAQVQKEEESFLEKITQKYGEGNIDINTGEFIPNIKN